MTERLPTLLRFRELILDRPEGGTRLRDWLGRPGGARAAETVEFSSDPYRSLKVAEGPLADAAWPELIERFGPELAGRRMLELKEAGLALEVKFLAADATAGGVRMLTPAAEDPPTPVAEGLTVLDSAPSAALYLGRRRNLPAEQFVACLRQDPSPDLLQEHPAETGTSLLLPAGFPWAPGRGVIAHSAAVRRVDKGTLEGRLIAGARGPAAESLRTPILYSRLVAKSLGWLDGPNAITWLYSAGWLSTLRLDLRQSWSAGRAAGESPAIVTGLDGRALVFAGGEMESVGPGVTVLIAASAGTVRLHPEAGGASLLLTWLLDPDTERDVTLTGRGLSRREIDGLKGVFGKEA